MAIPNIPPIVPRPIADFGNVRTIPDTTPAGTNQLSFESGFPPITSLPLATGGIPPQREDFNAALKLLSEHIFFQQSGGMYSWQGASGAFPGLNYLPGWRVKGSDGKEYVALQPSGPDVPGVGPRDPVASPAYWQLAVGVPAATAATATASGNLGTAKYAASNAPATVFDEAVTPNGLDVAVQYLKGLINSIDTGSGGGGFPGTPNDIGMPDGDSLSNGDINDLSLQMVPGRTYLIYGDVDPDTGMNIHDPAYGPCGYVSGLPKPGNYRCIISGLFSMPYTATAEDGPDPYPACGIDGHEQILYDLSTGAMYSRAFFPEFPFDWFGNLEIPLPAPKFTPWHRMGGGGGAGGGAVTEIDRRMESGTWTITDLVPYVPAYLCFYTESPLFGQDSVLALLGVVDGVAHFKPFDPESNEPASEAFILGWVNTGALLFQTVFIPSSDTVTFTLLMTSDNMGNNPPGNGVDYVAIMQ